MGKILKALTLAGLILLGSKVADALEKEQKKAELFNKIGIYLTQQSDSVSPADSYFKEENDKFRNGYYTFNAPIGDWKDIETPEIISSGAGLELKLLGVKKEYEDENYETKKSTYTIAKSTNSKDNTNNPKKKPKKKILKDILGFYIFGENSQSAMSSEYNETYEIWPEYNTIDNFDRKENIETKTQSIGARIKLRLAKWLSFFASSKQENYEVKGNVDHTYNGIDTGYVQWRGMNYSGKGTGNSVEAGFDFNLTKNISIGVSAGQRNGNVKTGGKENWTSTSNPGWRERGEYNPEFNFDSSYSNINLKLKF